MSRLRKSSSQQLPYFPKSLTLQNLLLPTWQDSVNLTSWNSCKIKQTINFFRSKMNQHHQYTSREEVVITHLHIGTHTSHPWKPPKINSSSPTISNAAPADQLTCPILTFLRKQYEIPSNCPSAPQNGWAYLNGRSQTGSRRGIDEDGRNAEQNGKNEENENQSSEPEGRTRWWRQGKPPEISEYVIPGNYEWFLSRSILIEQKY